jgi:hypothetical protein
VVRRRPPIFNLSRLSEKQKNHYLLVTYIQNRTSRPVTRSKAPRSADFSPRVFILFEFHPSNPYNPSDSWCLPDRFGKVRSDSNHPRNLKGVGRKKPIPPCPSGTLFAGTPGRNATSQGTFFLVPTGLRREARGCPTQEATPGSSPEDPYPEGVVEDDLAANQPVAILANAPFRDAFVVDLNGSSIAAFRHIRSLKHPPNPQAWRPDPYLEHRLSFRCFLPPNSSAPAASGVAHVSRTSDRS